MSRAIFLVNDMIVGVTMDSSEEIKSGHHEEDDQNASSVVMESGASGADDADVESDQSEARAYAESAEESSQETESESVQPQDEFAGLTDEERLIVTDPRYRWYIVNTYSGSEETVRLALKERIIRGGLEEQFGEIFVPKMVVEKVLKSGKKKLIDKTTFPGYIMVQMAMNDQTMGCVSSTPKVTGFVGNRRNPRAMGDNEVLRLLNPAVAAANKADDVSKQSFKKGEGIKVTDGPFTNFDGVIDEVRADKMKLKVLVSIFGRETPVELGYNQVEKQS